MGIRPSKAGQNASPGGERGLVFWEGAVTALSQQIAGGQSSFQAKGQDAGEGEGTPERVPHRTSDLVQSRGGGGGMGRGCLRKEELLTTSGTGKVH